MEQIFSVPNKYHGQGPVVAMQWQRKQSNLLACVGANKIVRIYDRKGTVVDNIPLPGQCTGMEWDAAGRVLAVAQDATGVIFLWDVPTKKHTQFDSGMKGVSFCKWSPKQSDVLAIGTNKGNLMLYNRATLRKVPLLGKHTRGIVDGLWLDATTLACASEDKTLSVSNAEGDTTETIALGAEPSQLKAFGGASDKRKRFISAVLASKSLLIHDDNRNKGPLELSFQAKYGTIVSYDWFRGDQFLLGFSNGYVIAMSAVTDLGKETLHLRDFKDGLGDLAVSAAAEKVATCGDAAIKVHDLGDLKNTSAIVTLEEARGSLDKLRWSEDGQFLTVSTKTGLLYTFLAKIPQIGDTFGSRMCYLSSLSEISVLECKIPEDMLSGIQQLDTESAIKMTITQEVGRLAMGASHIVTAVNNKIQGHAIVESGGTMPLFEREMRGHVVDLKMNRTHYAALIDGSVHVIPIDADPNGETQPMVLPTTTTFKVTTMCMSGEFVIVGSQQGHVQHYVMDETTPATEFRHELGICELAANQRGTRVVFVDTEMKGWMWNPIDDQCELIPGFPVDAKSVLFDARLGCNHDRLLVCTNDMAYIYVNMPIAINGKTLYVLGESKIATGLKPLHFEDDVVICLSATGKAVAAKLELETEADLSERLLRLYLQEKWIDFWREVRAVSVQEANLLYKLAEICLNFMDLTSAEVIYRHLGDVAMVMTVRDLREKEDRNLIAGHVSVLLADYNAAQEHFLSSDYPKAALDMRCDMLQWDQALSLASKLATEEIPSISLQYAQQLENKGNHRESMDMYNRALRACDELIGSQTKTLDRTVLLTMITSIKAGMARESLRTGDIPRGMRLLDEIMDKTVVSQCAVILENLKQLLEAAVLFERAESYEKAAELYIKLKKYAKVGELLAKIKAPKIHGQYAKAKEAEGDFVEAALGYQRAGDTENLIRVYVQHLRKIDEAVGIVRETKSREGAKLVMQFFQDIKDYRSVVEFCLIAGMSDEALNYAKANGQMELYAALIETEASTDMLLNVAAFFEQNGQLDLAGKYYMKVGDLTRAFQLLLQSGGDRAMELAIELVASSKSETMCKQLTDYLLGQNDGQTKNPKYIFKMYISMGNFVEAAKTAVIIALDEQAAGNYRQAHDLLFECYRKLRNSGAKVPADIDRSLAILHSYVQVKVMVKLDDHDTAARLLKRVADNISKFPARRKHIIPILTSTVFECHRAGMKQSAFNYASILCRPENRSKIDEKYKRKIELMVRRREEEETEERSTPCPFCNAAVPEMSLDCGACRNRLPFCIASGAHIVESDFCACSHCEFPAIYTRLCKVLGISGTCPMCEKPLRVEQLQRRSATSFLRQQTQPHLQSQLAFNGPPPVAVSRTTSKQSLGMSTKPVARVESKQSLTGGMMGSTGSLLNELSR